MCQIGSTWIFLRFHLIYRASLILIFSMEKKTLHVICRMLINSISQRLKTNGNLGIDIFKYFSWSTSFIQFRSKLSLTFWKWFTNFQKLNFFYQWSIFSNCTEYSPIKFLLELFRYKSKIQVCLRLFLLYFGTFYRKILQVKHKYTIKILKK